MAAKGMLARIVLLGLALSLCVGAAVPAGGAPTVSDVGKDLFLNPDGSVRKIINTDPARLTGSPTEIADAFLLRVAPRLFGTDAEAKGDGLAVGEIKLSDVRTVSSLTGFHVWKQAYVAGVPVHNGYVVTHLTHDGRVLFATNDVGSAEFALDATTAKLRASEALAQAAAFIGGDGATRVEPVAELVVLRQEGRDRLAWRTVTASWNPYGDWEIFVDATTGRELARRDLLIVDGRDPKPASLTPPAEDPTKALPPYDPAAALRADGSGLVFIANPLNNQPSRYSWRDQDAIIDTARDAVTLTNLDGTGYLRGPWVEVFNTDAARAYEPTLVFEYSALPENGHFQEVNVYYHINRMQEYFQNDLGIPNARNRVTNCYAHQGSDDNSDYSFAEDRIRYGDGGVDDSDDGEVVVHEYGHAVHEDVVPGFVYSGETGAISEGIGDYFAALLGNNALLAEWDATAYNPGPPPYLRRADNDKHYPEDFVGEVHDDGEIVSATFWDLRQLVGPVLGDQLILAGLFYTGTTATFQDYADGVVAADQALYGGAHLGQIYMAFGNRGIGPTYLLSFNHTPLGDTENTAGPYPVVTTITHTSPISAPDAVQLHYMLPGDVAFTDAAMAPTGGFDEWAGAIPGPGVNGTVTYYLSVTDDMAVSGRLPTVPDTYFTFVIGPDSQPPVIVHTPLRAGQPLLTWPPVVNATVTDNLGLAEVTLLHTLNGVPQAPVPMTDGGGGAYSAVFPELALDLSIGDQFGYTIRAVDASSQSLVTTSGPHAFEIIDALGVVLVLDDDPDAGADVGKFTKDKQPVPPQERDPQTLGASSSAMATVLTDAGWVVTEEPAATSDPATWAGYSFILLSSGGNTSPVADTALRAALETYVAAGGKLLWEGGEIGYDAISYPGYPSFAENVVHGDDWDCDNCGAGLHVAPGRETHPIMTLPHAVSPTLAINFVGYGDQDGFQITDDAYGVMYTNSTSYTTDAGIVVYDNDVNPASAQIVGYAFNYAALVDQTMAAKLLENTAQFLTAEQQPGSGGIHGTCYVQGAVDNSGVTVTCNPGGLSFVTGPTGAYEFTDLFAGTYMLTATKPGYGSSPLEVTLGEGQHVYEADFGLGVVQEFTFCETIPGGVAIPDYNTVGITRSLIVTEAGILSNIYCSVNITHTWKGDLVVDLTSPQGTTVRLHNRTGSSQDNIITTYDSITLPDGPGVMNDFDGEDPVGEWRLFVADGASGDVGRLNEWCLNLFVAEPVVGVSASPPTAMAVQGGVRLSWTYDPAQVDAFHVYRRVAGGPAERLTDSPLSGSEGRVAFTDPAAGLVPGTDLRYSYAMLKSGQEIGRSEEIAVTLGSGAPRVFALAPVYPNPFNPLTNIKFAVPKGGHVELRVYDVVGRLVRTLVDADLPAAEHVLAWDGKNDAGQAVPSGTYYCRMTAEGFRAVQKMTLLK